MILMSTKQIYSKNPIIEALIDVQIEPPLAVGPEVIEAIHEKIINYFPKKRTQRTYESMVEIKETEPPRHKHRYEINGYQFWSENELEVCQFRPNGYSY